MPLFRIPAMIILSLLLSSLASADLLTRWEKERQSPESTFTEQLREAMSAHQVVFVGGYLNEGIVGYFTDNNNAVRESFYCPSMYTLPDSYKTVPENSVLLRTLVGRRYFEKNRTPIILVGHSKGGAESLYTALRYPELILGGAIDKVVIIQGALGGSPIANTLRNSRVSDFLTSGFKGLDALQQEEMDQLFTDAIQQLKSRLGRKVFEIISSRIFFVRGAQTGARISKELLITHKYMTEHFEEGNDGLLLVSDQLISGVGTDLGILNADHADLTVASFLSNEKSEFRTSFTRALMGEIFEYPSLTAF